MLAISHKKHSGPRRRGRHEPLWQGAGSNRSAGGEGGLPPVAASQDNGAGGMPPPVRAPGFGAFTEKNAVVTSALRGVTRRRDNPAAHSCCWVAVWRAHTVARWGHPVRRICRQTANRVPGMLVALSRENRPCRKPSTFLAPVSVLGATAIA